MNLPFLQRIAYAILFSILFYSPAFGQTITAEKQDSILSKQKDVIDLLQNGFHAHLRKDSISMKGNGPFISIMPVVGYSLQSGLTGAIVSNTSFYTDSTRNKFSNLLLNAYYSEYHQYWFTANTNIFYEKYKLHLFGDTRYYNFPTQTFGYGTSSKLSDELDIKYSYLRICQIVYREIIPNTFLELDIILIFTGI